MPRIPQIVPGDNVANSLCTRGKDSSSWHAQLALQCPRETLASVGRVLDRVAALAQAAHEEAGRLGVVFDEQYVHGAGG